MQVKILGWLLLSTCRFTTMVSYLFGKLCAIAISGIRQLLDFPSLMCTVNANVFSKLFYCFSVWACTSKGTLRGFNKFKTLKPEFGHITPTLQQRKFLPVSILLQFRDASLLYKSINGLAQQYIFKRSDIHNRHTRYNVKLQQFLNAGQPSLRTISYTVFLNLVSNTKQREYLVNLFHSSDRFRLITQTSSGSIAR